MSNTKCCKCPRPATTIVVTGAAMCDACLEEMNVRLNTHECTECKEISTTAVMLDQLWYCRNCIPRVTKALECAICAGQTNVFTETNASDIGVICKACRDDCYYHVRPGRTLRNKPENSD